MNNMSISHIQSSEVNSIDANNAKKKLKKWVNIYRSDLKDESSTQSFESISIRAQSTSISKKFQVCNERAMNRNLLNDTKNQSQVRTHAAKILNCSTDQIFFTNHIVMRYYKLNSLKLWMSAAQKERIITIIVLDDLDSDNDLLKFDDSSKYFSLISEQTLHALTDVSQHFKNHSINWALVLSWTRRIYDVQSLTNTES